MRLLPTILLALPLLCGVAAVHADPSPLLPADAPVAAASQEEWSRRWWEWAASFPNRESPVADRTGALCGSGQSGPVWFLAGTYGSQRVLRTCHVPEGRYLFFPLINYVVMGTIPGATCPGVIAQARELTQPATSLVLEIDGVREENLVEHRLASRGCFDLGARTAQQVRIFPSTSNGYYAMLKPLPKGRHTLNFGGIVPNMMQAVTYEIVVD